MCGVVTLSLALLCQFLDTWSQLTTLLNTSFIYLHNNNNNNCSAVHIDISFYCFFIVWPVFHVTCNTDCIAFNVVCEYLRK